MSFQPLSRLCVLRLTQSLELNCLEGLQQLEECPYVAKNIEIEDKLPFNHIDPPISAVKSKSPKLQVKKLFKGLSKKEMPHVFGQPVSESTLLTILQLIDYLKSNASIEGLFRVSGNKKRQEEMKTILSRNENINLNDADCPFNAHDIAGILKHFFSELPEPLLTKTCFVCYQQLAGKLKDMDSIIRHKRKVDTLKMLFLLLPPLNRLLLKKLIKLLSVVAADETNKMTAYNLGVIFAPNIVCTRQPMGCLSDFTENVEPFTDLVKFIIENASEVFKIPQDFLEDGKQYINQVSADQTTDVEVPMSKTYCQQIDSKEFAKEGKDNTHQELMLLYSQMMDLPDGPLKKDFLEKFRQSYPGTPMFIPKSVKEKQKEIHQPSTPAARSKFGGCLNRNSTVKKAASENFLDKKSDSTLILGSSSRFGTPGQSEDNILAAYSNSHMLSSTAGTPSRVKKFCKRLRRRSVELFNKGGKDTKQNSSCEHLGEEIEKSTQSSGMKSLFRSYRKPTGTWKGLKKSISTPTLFLRRKSSSASSEEEEDDFGKRKLSFSGETEPEKLEGQLSDKPDVFDKGFVNDAFIDNPLEETPIKVQTPIIRKTLYPTVIVRADNSKSRNDKPTKATDVLQNTENTPKIMKPKYQAGQTVNQSGSLPNKQKPFKASGQIKKLTSFRKGRSGNSSRLADVTNSKLPTPAPDSKKILSKKSTASTLHDKENAPVCGK